MLCPYCHYSCEDQDRYCSNCGAPIVPAPEKKGRHWVPILAMVLIFAFGLSLFFALPGGSQSKGQTSREMPWFTVDEGVLYFRAADYTGSGELVIPESIGGITVTSISDGCFENCTELTSVILPPALQSIGAGAFRNCTALRGIEIPQTVRAVGESAFHGCTSLEAVCIYNSIKHIGDQAFNGCTKLFYIFFEGYHDTWTGLYSEYINPYTSVSCLDGSFYQGGVPD